MESDHHLLCNPDFSNTADVASFTLRTVRSTMPFDDDDTCFKADVPRMPERTLKLAKSQLANLTLLSPQTHVSESANSFTFSLYERLKLTRTSPHTLPPSTCTRDSGAFVVWMKTTWRHEQVSALIHSQPVREIPGIYGVNEVHVALEDLDMSSPNGPWRFGNECCLQWFHCILMPSLHAWTVFTVKTGLALRLKARTCTIVEQARRWIPKLYSCSHLRDNPETSIS